ncbi:MAG TPA: hypothetical protein VJ739_02915 [Gemmataceae bacterium]|nr:hypothetical protein [Gemmataceae bacterium]
MSTPSTTEQQVLQALRDLPPARWGEVLEFIRSLQAHGPDKGSLPPIRTATDLAQSSLISIWEDRSDITDSQAFARRLRSQAEQRERTPKDL